MSKADWAGASVPTMWTSAQAADTEMAWQQVSAWQRTYDLLLHHEMRLEACRDELTFAWPPERSPAATAFVEYIDGLLVSIRRAKDDAVENHKALAGVLTSLASTRADMDKLKAEWDRHAADDAAMAANLPNDLFASGENWQENLNEKARTRMAKNDQEVFEAAQKMVELSPVHGNPLYNREPFDPKSGSADASALKAATVGGSASSGSWMVPPSVTGVSSVDVSLGLASSGLPNLHPAGQLTGSQPHSPTSGPTPVPAISAPAALVPGQSGRAAARTPVRGAGGGFAKGGSRPISGSPSGAASSDAVPGGRRANTMKVGPVGGVIAGAGASTIHGAMPIAPMGRAGGPDGQVRDPLATLQWEVVEGGSPVIEPVPERPFCLGPGVIGADGA